MTNLKAIREKQERWRKVPLLKLWWKASRWPWHVKTQTAILDLGGKPLGEKWGWSNKALGGMGRFGGGWRWKLGMLCGGSSLLIDLIWGSVHIDWNDPPARARERALKDADRKRVAEATKPVAYKDGFDPEIGF